jgi:hypothetical protein
MLINLLVFLLLSYALFHLFTVSKPHESNEVKMSIFAICVNCNPEGVGVELDKFGCCCYCGSNSVIKREPKKLGLTEGQKLINRLNKK